MINPTPTDDARRDFLGQCGSALQALVLAGTMGPLIAACEVTENTTAPPTGNDIEIDVASLDADGDFLVSDKTGPDGQKILVVRKNATTYLALSTRCTHEGCAVNPPADNQIICPCHGSRYDMDGAVLNGPAPLPLTRYETTFDPARAVLTVKA